MTPKLSNKIYRTSHFQAFDAIHHIGHYKFNPFQVSVSFHIENSHLTGCTNQHWAEMGSADELDFHEKQLHKEPAK